MVVEICETFVGTFTIAWIKLIDEQYRKRQAACETRNASPAEKLWGK